MMLTPNQYIDHETPSEEEPCLISSISRGQRDLLPFWRSLDALELDVVYVFHPDN